MADKERNVTKSKPNYGRKIALALIIGPQCTVDAATFLHMDDIFAKESIGSQTLQQYVDISICKLLNYL